MIRQLADPANAITTMGLILSVAGIHLALDGRVELAVAIVLWALLADHLDGVVAARTKNRSPETGKIGKSLDSLADLVSAGVFPATVVMQVGEASWLAFAVGAVLVVASALRLSYFNAYGLANGRFIGVPTTYAVPLMTVLFLVRPLVPPPQFEALLYVSVLLLAVLHVTPVPVPRTSGAMYAVVTLFAVTSSAVLVSRAMG